MDTKSIFETIMNFNMDTVFLFLKFLVAAIVIVTLKYIIECISSYITLRLDEYVHEGTPIEVYGKKGRIRKISYFTVVVETECGFIPISTRNWKTSKYVVLKDQWNFQRRKEDRMEVTVKATEEKVV